MDRSSYESSTPFQACHIPHLNCAYPDDTSSSIVPTPEVASSAPKEVTFLMPEMTVHWFFIYTDEEWGPSHAVHRLRNIPLAGLDHYEDTWTHWKPNKLDFGYLRQSSNRSNKLGGLQNDFWREGFSKTDGVGSTRGAGGQEAAWRPGTRRGWYLLEDYSRVLQYVTEVVILVCRCSEYLTNRLIRLRDGLAGLNWNHFVDITWAAIYNLNWVAAKHCWMLWMLKNVARSFRRWWLPPVLNVLLCSI